MALVLTPNFRSGLRRLLSRQPHFWNWHANVFSPICVITFAIANTHYSSSNEPAKDRISLLALCATLNDSATAAVSSSPSPQVAVMQAADPCNRSGRGKRLSNRAQWKPCGEHSPYSKGSLARNLCLTSLSAPDVRASFNRFSTTRRIAPRLRKHS
jgi:hypothetical protein